jgi:hypothetical protein
MNELDYSEKLKELKIEAPFCSTIPRKLFHCLSEEHLRLALILQSHSSSGVNFSYQLGSITNGEKPFFSAGFEKDTISKDKFPSQLDCVFRGVWILRIEQSGIDLRLGEGCLRISAYDDLMMHDTERFRPLSLAQIGYIWLLDRSRSIKEEGFPDGTLEIEVTKFERIYKMIGESPFAFWFDDCAPCSPGFKSPANQNEVFGQVFSVGFKEVVITNRGSLNLMEQGGNLFLIELEKIPDNKINLAKYLKARLGISISEIINNLTEQIEPKWVVFSSSLLNEIIEIFVELDKLGTSPRVYTK